MHAVDPTQVKAHAKWLTQDEMFNEFLAMRSPTTTNWVTFSGGNPCIHDLSHLTKLLRDNNFRIALETQGTIYQEWVPACDVVTVSPKGPGMGERLELDKLDAFLDHCHRKASWTNLKVVVFDQRDLEVAKMLFCRYIEDAGYHSIPFYLSLGNPYPPRLDGVNSYPRGLEYALINLYRILFEDIKNDPTLSKMRYLPQLHTWVWGNDRGR